MKKIMEIRGMNCEHCRASVEKSLNVLEGVEAKVDLKKSIALVNLKKDMPDEILKNAVEQAGFEVVVIKDKKGLFG